MNIHSSLDERFMAMALRLGRRGQGRVWPNPAVGCVIVSGERVLGRGWTQAGGRPHAEPQALAQAGPAAHGATAYASLEPCSHHGKTPPCVEALIEAGIARVVVAIEDPDPRVQGNGVRRLREAGLQVEVGISKEAANRDHCGFFSRIRRGRPWITLKLASSLDGRIATATGESKWITGGRARKQVQHLRSRYDAVMVGGGTARADDPDLRVREWQPERQPVRIVVSRTADLPVHSRVLDPMSDVPLWLVHAEGRLDLRRHIEKKLQRSSPDRLALFPTPLTDDQIDLSAMAHDLGSAGLTRVLCEGGGRLAASLLRVDLVDELVVFHAGVVLGAEGAPAFGDLGVERLADAARFRLEDMRSIGGDLVSSWLREPQKRSMPELL